MPLFAFSHSGSLVTCTYPWPYPWGLLVWRSQTRGLYKRRRKCRLSVDTSCKAHGVLDLRHAATIQSGDIDAYVLQSTWCARHVQQPYRVGMPCLLDKLTWHSFFVVHMSVHFVSYTVAWDMLSHILITVTSSYIPLVVNTL